MIMLIGVLTEIIQRAFGSIPSCSVGKKENHFCLGAIYSYLTSWKTFVIKLNEN